jgi:Icc-related predicted phosphoesterase
MEAETSNKEFMLILYACDMYCDIAKFSRLFSICKNFHPTFTIINSNIFVQKENKTDPSKIVYIIEEMSKHSTILLQYGGMDLLTAHDLFKNKNQAIVNITNRNYETPEICFSGLSFLSGIDNSPWNLDDSNKNVDPIKSSEFLIRKAITENGIHKTIFISTMPPTGILDYDPNPKFSGSYTIRKLCEGEFSNKIQPILILSGLFTDNFKYTSKWFHILDKCLCIQPSQIDDGLYFSLIEIQPTLEISNFYHPEDFVTTLKRNLNHAPTTQD